VNLPESFSLFFSWLYRLKKTIPDFITMLLCLNARCGLGWSDEMVEKTFPRVAAVGPYSP
jgi:hypothetical protein